MSQFSSRDSSAVLLESRGRGGSGVVLSPFYMAHDGLVHPPLLAKLITFCYDGNLGLVIGCDSNDYHMRGGSSDRTGCDSNDYHMRGGSSDRNRRGHNLAEFLAINQISWCNVGNTPNFHIANRKGG